MVFFGKKLCVAHGAKALPDKGQDTILPDEFWTFISTHHAHQLHACARLVTNGTFGCRLIRIQLPGRILFKRQQRAQIMQSAD